MSERRIIINNYHAPSKCSKCGFDMKFKGVGSYQCERCHHVEYDDYGLVRNYIEIHPGASTAEVSDATGVEQRQINEMLRDERLEIASDSKVFLKCDGCGKEIRFGKYCVECSKLEAAARARKSRDKERERRKDSMSGVAIAKETASGAKRFERK